MYIVESSQDPYVSKGNFLQHWVSVQVDWVGPFSREVAHYKSPKPTVLILQINFHAYRESSLNLSQEKSFHIIHHSFLCYINCLRKHQTFIFILNEIDFKFLHSLTKFTDKEQVKGV